jgi:hypothetical protein
MTLTIPIISTFSDKGLKKASKSVDSFAKSATRSLAAVFGVAAIERFSRASVKAFLADDKAATILTKTITNLGVAFNDQSLKSYIQNLQDTTGVLDDSLRPAFSSLIVATQDYKTAQDLLTTALDISAGTGKDLQSVSQALSKAYLGNYASLSRLGAGISKADVQAGNFDEMLKKLNKTFTGSALTAAQTYSGQVDLLKAAFTDLQEAVGEGLIISLQDLGKDKSVSTLQQNMKNLGDNAKYAIIGVGDLLEKIQGIKKNKRTMDLLSSLFFSLPKLLITQGKISETAKEAFLYNTPDITVYIKQKKKVLDLETASMKAAKAKAALDKANRALDFAGTIFDLDKIQLYAALQGKITAEDRDKLTLKLLLLNAENQTGDALAKSAREATLLSEKILMQNGLVMTYDGLIKNLATAKNPFEGFDKYLQDLLNKMRDIQLAIDKINSINRINPGGNAILIPQNPGPGAISIGPASGNTFTPGSIGGVGNPMGPVLNNMATNNDFGTFGNTFTPGSIGGVGNPMGNYSTIINVNASYIANPQEIQDVVQNAIQNANRAGNNTNYAGGLGF